MIELDEKYRKYAPLFDLHTHSVSSGHGSLDTTTDMCNVAIARGLEMLGVSEHGPDTLNSGTESFFRNLAALPRTKCSLPIMYGAELNILNPDGDVDLPDDITATLDYAIISQHILNYEPGTIEENTCAYINAMRHPKVCFIGHPDDDVYPLDREALIEAAKAHHVYPEINNTSLKPNSYREGGDKNCREILRICKKLNHPILMSSDSHGVKNIGNFEYIYPVLCEIDFPPELVINTSFDMLSKILDEHKNTDPDC